MFRKICRRWEARREGELKQNKAAKSGIMWILREAQNPHNKCTYAQRNNGARRGEDVQLK